MSEIINPQWPIGMMEEIESILSRHHEWPDGLDSYDAVFDSATFYPLQRRRELEKMMQLCRSINPQTVMVIGADRGGDVFHFVKCLPTVRRVIACEIRGTPYAESFIKYFPLISFRFMPRSSAISLREFADLNHWLNGNIDVLFIDGDKNAFGADFNLYSKFMKAGSIAMMHDICLPRHQGSCRIDFENVSKNYADSSQVIIDLSEHRADQEAQARGEPVKNAYGAWVRHWNDFPTCGVGVIRI